MKTKNLYTNIGLPKRNALVINTLYTTQFSNEFINPSEPNNTDTLFNREGSTEVYQDYIDKEGSGKVGEKVSGTFVSTHRFVTKGCKYALIRLDDERRIRVAKKYFNQWGNGTIDRLQPGDRLTLTRMTFSPKLHHYAWTLNELPVRLIINSDSEGIDAPQLNEPNAPKGWAEHDEDFKVNKLVAGRITEIKKMYRSKFLYMMVELTDGRMTCVNRRAFIGSRFSPRDFAVGDLITLRKGGFSHSTGLNDWILNRKVTQQGQSPMCHIESRQTPRELQ